MDDRTARSKTTFAASDKILKILILTDGADNADITPAPTTTIAASWSGGDVNAGGSSSRAGGLWSNMNSGAVVASYFAGSIASTAVNNRVGGLGGLLTSGNHQRQLRDRRFV